ncbi:MAG: hypothetical protein K2P69_02875 [Eubacterium sp.]|nr:hypothetical protein [Eubacterium sp.]
MILKYNGIPALSIIRETKPTQIIVSDELDKSGYTWLTALSAKMNQADMEHLLRKIDALKLTSDKELADSVLEISVRANQTLVKKLRGDGHMCQALLEIMEPEINKIKASVAESVTQSVTESVTQSVTQEVTQAKISSAVRCFHDFGIDDVQIKQALIKHFHLSADEADGYLQESI